MFWEEITKLVTQTSWIVFGLLGLGIVLCLIEAVIPSYGFVGISGLVSLVAGIVLHAFLSGSVLQVVIMLAIVLLILILIILLFIRSAKYGILGKSALVENHTALPINYSDQLNNVNVSLIGQVGVVVTDCRPVGKMQFGDEILDVLSRDDFLYVGEKAKVIDVVGNNVYVEKIVKGVLK